ncbi:MAG TPA: phosphatase PAP2 family protein [Ktedonobacterales bacterium]|nr:phosphatase PAP2 family protein [Ktedonobacterales bacterium]
MGVAGGSENRETDEPPEQAEQTEHPLDKLTESAKERTQHIMREARQQIARERLPGRHVLARGRAVLLGYALAVLALLALTAAVSSGGTTAPIDLPFTRELQETRNPIVFGVLYAISFIGFNPYSAAIFIITVLLLVLLRLRLEALFLLSVVVADGLGFAIKLIVARQRPSSALVDVVQQINGPSFPSGHTLHYTVFYGFLAFVLAVSFRASWLRNLLIAICALLVALVGISRIYLGEHWLTDVLGGYLLGGLFLVPMIAGFLWARARYDSATLRRLPRTEQPG